MYVWVPEILVISLYCYQVDIKPLRQRGVLYGSGNPVTLHPYAAQARMGSLKKDQKWAYAPLARVSNLARAMGYLVGICISTVRYLQLMLCLCR